VTSVRTLTFNWRAESHRKWTC